jgi:hypothetical protein
MSQLVQWLPVAVAVVAGGAAVIEGARRGGGSSATRPLVVRVRPRRR